MTSARSVAIKPLALWGLGFYMATMGIHASVDIPLLVFGLMAAAAFSQAGETISRGAWLQRHWAVLIFVLTTVLVTWSSRDIGWSMDMQRHFLPGLLVYTVVFHFVRDSADRLTLFRIVVVSACAVLLQFWQGALTGQPLTPQEHVTWLNNALFIVPNDVLYLSVLSPFAVALLLTDKWLWRLLALGVLTVTLATVVYIQSRQGLLVYVFGATLVLALYRPLWVIPVILALITGGLALDVYLGSGLLQKLFFWSRTYVWHAAWEMFLDRPWLGQGPAMFKPLYLQYLEEAGYIYQQLEDRRYMAWAHNLYLEQLAERGIIGLFALLVLLGRGFYKCALTYYKTPENDNAKTIQSGAHLSAFVCLLIAGIAEASLLRLWVIVLLFLLIGLAEASVQEPTNGRTTPHQIG